MQNASILLCKSKQQKALCKPGQNIKMLCRGVFRILSNIYDGDSLKK